MRSRVTTLRPGRQAGPVAAAGVVERGAAAAGETGLPLLLPAVRRRLPAAPGAHAQREHRGQSRGPG